MSDLLQWPTILETVGAPLVATGTGSARYFLHGGPPPVGSVGAGCLVVAYHQRPGVPAGATQCIL